MVGQGDFSDVGVANEVVAVGSGAAVADSEVTAAAAVGSASATGALHPITAATKAIRLITYSGFGELIRRRRKSKICDITLIVVCRHYAWR